MTTENRAAGWGFVERESVMTDALYERDWKAFLPVHTLADGSSGSGRRLSLPYSIWTKRQKIKNNSFFVGEGEGGVETGKKKPFF